MSHQPAANTLLSAIHRYRRRFPDETAVVARFDRLLRDYPNCFERNCWAGHITGSAFLLDATRERTLLTHHRKLGKWLQPGGHSDGDADTLGVALREAEEETGLRVRPLLVEILDLDVHEIPARGDDPAHHHFDVRFALCSEGSDAFAVSEESHDLAWVPLDALEDYTDEWSVLRLRERWRNWPRPTQA